MIKLTPPLKWAGGKTWLAPKLAEMYEPYRDTHTLAVFDRPVVASNKATDRIIDLYKSLGFAIEYIEAPRRIACNGDRKPVTEMLATKNI